MAAFGNLTMIGDSLTRGSGTTYYSPAQALQNLLTGAGHTVTFVGLRASDPGSVPVSANGGNTIADVVADIPAVDALNPVTLVVQIGSNDVGVSNPSVDDDITDYLDDLVTALGGMTGKRIYVCATLNPGWFDSASYTLLYNAQLAWVAANANAYFVDLNLAGLTSGDFVLGHHYTSGGATKIATYIFNAMQASITAPPAPTPAPIPSIGEIAIRGGGVSTLHADALLETLGTQRNWWSDEVISAYIGTDPKLQLYRDATKVYDRVLNGDCTVVNGNIVLPTSWDAAATTHTAADIDTGVWSFRLVKASDATKYLEGTAGPIGSGKHLILSADLDGTIGVTLTGITLQAPSDLDEGYVTPAPGPTPPPPGAPPAGVAVYNPQLTVDDMGLQNDYNAIDLPNWNQPTWAVGGSTPPGAVVMGNRGIPSEVSWWWNSAQGQNYPNAWRYWINWMVVLYGAGHVGANNAVKISRTKMIARRRSDGAWVTILSGATASHDWWQWDPSGGQTVRSQDMFGIQNPTPGTYLLHLGDPLAIPAINRTFPHGVWGGIISFDPTPYDCIMHVGLVSLELWNPAGTDARGTSQITFQMGGDYYPTQGNALSWYPGAFVSRSVRVTSTPRWMSVANLTNANQAYNGANASVTPDSFLQKPPSRTLVEA
jgi:hypothetical protein